MNQSELIHAIDTLYHRTYVPITLLDDEAGSLVFPRYAPIMSLKEKFEYLFVDDEFPLHIVNTYEMLGASFLYTSDQKRYRILIGPCALLNTSITSKFTYDIKAYISSETLESFKDYCVMFYELIMQCSLDAHQIPIKYLHKEKLEKLPEETFEENLYERRSHDATSDSYQFELRFLEYVKKGQKEKIDWIFSKINKTYEVHLADDFFESTKLKFVTIVTLLTRQAIACGVPLDSAFSLSDALIQGLKNIHTAPECIRYMKYASYQFCDLIQSQAKQCSTLINQCLRYIDAHLYEKITLEDLSCTTGKSAVYISSRFKKEVGESFSDYVLKKKIEEAKQLLLFTDYSFQEISSLLNFTSQSHFTQRFKQICGQTPKGFRDKNFQY